MDDVPVTWPLILMIIGALFTVAGSTATIVGLVTRALSTTREKLYARIDMTRDAMTKKHDELQADFNAKHNENAVERGKLSSEIHNLHNVIRDNYVHRREFDLIQRAVERLRIKGDGDDD